MSVNILPVKEKRSSSLALSDTLDSFSFRRRYLIGVSGGRDSVALLHELFNRGYKNLVVCHLDHQLRGRASTEDARFTLRVAKSLELSCEIATTDVAVLAKKMRASIETAARVARYGFFNSVARRRRCRTIFLAHHADDLVETALLNLFRGAGPAGVAAMREISRHRIGRSEITIVRPFLGVWRKDIDRYVEANSLEYREDQSNRSVAARRNRIRHRVLPGIEKELGRAVSKNVWRMARIWADEDLFLESLGNEKSAPDRLHLNVASLRKLPVALQRRTIRSWLQRHEMSGVTFDAIENIRRLVQADAKGAKVNLSRNCFVRRQNKKLFVEGNRPRKTSQGSVR